MKSGWRAAVVATVAILAAAAGFLVSRNTVDSGDAGHVAPDAGAAVLALTLPDATGSTQSLAQWRGSVLVVNFWATWCPPCLAEIPDFAAASRSFSGAAVQFVGIGIDRVESVRSFDDEHEIPYPLLVGTPQTLELTAELGNRAQALPFTVIFDRDGNIAHIKLGALNRTELEGKIRALLAG
jgi:peroxiredoxin